MNKKIKDFLTPKYILITLTVFCLLLSALTLMTNKFIAPIRAVVSYVVIPMQRGMNNLGLWTSDKAATMQELVAVMDENASLKQKVDELVEENNQLKQDGYELTRLRELYQLDEKYPGYTKVGARVIGKGSDNWFNTFTVDKGSDDGIEVNMNVIAGGGLVGIVSSVGKNYSTVHAIIDDSSRVSGMLIDTGDNCIVDGDIKLMDSGLIRIEYIKKDVVIRDGDKIVTSNISDNYLEGILIGYAKDVTMDANNLTQSGYLVPVVDFAHLQEVLIIKEKKNKS